MTVPPDVPVDWDAPLETMWEGRFIKAQRRGKWEFVGRSRGIRAAVILAEQDGRVILIEQYRVALGRRCLELPAGLIGDASVDDDVETAAIRELEEETGFRAGAVEPLGEYFSSPGMVAESFNLVRARDLVRVGPGVDGEHIIVHEVPRETLPAFIAERGAAGVAIDVKLLALLDF